MDYHQVLKRLAELVDYEKTAGYDYDLDAFRHFLKRFGSPETKLPNVILVAGTKGKGSTCAMLEAAVRAGGWRTALYSSPHLVRVNERIRINNRPIPDRDFARIGTRVVRAIGPSPGARSFFEALTAIGFLHFAENKVDFAILEVGLGGRLDATNVSRPLITVITRIGLDHTNLLGSTLKQIAREKAGIIRRKCPLVLGIQRPAVGKLLMGAARARQAPLVRADRIGPVKILDETLEGTEAVIGSDHIRLGLPGRHQVENLRTALAVVELLREKGWSLPAGKVRGALEHMRLAGRIEVISRRPLIVLDVAHNPDSFQALYRLLKRQPRRRLLIVFGVTKDKDARFAYRRIFPMASRIFLTRAAFPRAKSPADILHEVGAIRSRSEIVEPVRAAVNRARRMLGPDDCLVIFGSFYVVGEAMEELKKRS